MKKQFVFIFILLISYLITSFQTAETVSSYQKISDTDGNFTGVLDDSDFFGMRVANLVDLDGDGAEDIAIGTPGDADVGAVWILKLDNGETLPIELLDFNASLTNEKTVTLEWTTTTKIFNDY